MGVRVRGVWDDVRSPCQGKQQRSSAAVGGYSRLCRFALRPSVSGPCRATTFRSACRELPFPCGRSQHGDQNAGGAVANTARREPTTLGGRAVRFAPPGRCASVDPRRVGSSRHSPTATRRKADAFSRSRPDGACAVVHRLRFWLRHFQSRPQAKRAANSPTAFPTSSSMRMFRTRAWGPRSWQFTDCAVWKIDAQLVTRHLRPT